MLRNDEEIDDCVKHLKKQGRHIGRDRMAALPVRELERLMMDSCILDEIERDIDRLDGVAIRMLIRQRTKFMYNKTDMAKEETKN